MTKVHLSTQEFKNREFWTHAGFYFFPDHLENRCQLVMLVKKGFELELDGMNVSFFNSLHAYKNSAWRNVDLKKSFFIIKVIFFSYHFCSWFSSRSKRSKLQRLNYSWPHGYFFMGSAGFRFMFRNSCIKYDFCFFCIVTISSFQLFANFAIFLVKF